MMIIMELGWHEFFLYGNDSGFSLELQIRDSTKNHKMDFFLVWYILQKWFIAWGLVAKPSHRKLMGADKDGDIYIGFCHLY